MKTSPLVRLLVMIALTTTLAKPASAERIGPPPMAVGEYARIELMTSGAPVIGVIRAMDERSVTIETNGGVTVRTSRDEIESLQIRVAVGRQAMKGAAIGAAAGFAAGALLGAMAESSLQVEGREQKSPDILTAAVYVGSFLAGPAAGVGALVGRTQRTYGWVEVLRNPRQSDSSSVTVLEAACVAGPEVETPPTPRRVAPAGSSKLLGAYVRVRYHGAWVKGSLVEVSDDAISLAGESGLVVLPRSGVDRMEMAIGKKGHLLRGALIGTVVAAASDFSSPPMCIAEASTGPSSQTSCSRFESASTSALGGAILGAAIGLVAKKTLWSPLSMEDMEGRDGRAAASRTVWRIDPTLGRGRSVGLRLQMAW
ncbi:MAG: hypothetical protein ABI672_15290 [Vicinamibacteria bacterium]